MRSTPQNLDNNDPKSVLYSMGRGVGVRDRLHLGSRSSAQTVAAVRRVLWPLTATPP